MHAKKWFRTQHNLTLQFTFD